MFGIERQTGFRGSRQLSGRVLVLVLCLALVALLAVAQVAHIHFSSAEADHCQLCITLQSAAPLAAAAMLVILVALTAQVRLTEQRVPVRRIASRLYSRPPPAGR